MPDVTKTEEGQRISLALRRLRQTTTRLRTLELQQSREAAAAKDAGATLAAIGQATGMTREGARQMTMRGGQS